MVLGYWFPKNFSEQLIAKTIVDFNCKPTSGFGTCMLAGVQISRLGLPSVDSLTSNNSWLIKISSLRFKPSFFLKHQDSPLFSWFPVSHLAWKYMSYAGYFKRKEKKKENKINLFSTFSIFYFTFIQSMNMKNYD